MDQGDVCKNPGCLPSWNCVARGLTLKIGHDPVLSVRVEFASVPSYNSGVTRPRDEGSGTLSKTL